MAQKYGRCEQVYENFPCMKTIALGIMVEHKGKTASVTQKLGAKYRALEFNHFAEAVKPITLR